MSAETKKKILDAIGEEFRAAGLGRFNDAIRLMDKESTYVLRGLKGGIFASAMYKLADATEPSAKTLEETLDKIKGKLRYDLRPVIMKSLQEYKRRLPYRHEGGRPEALTAQQKGKACDAVAALIRRGGINLKGAFLRVSQEFSSQLGRNVSARTIQRAWQGRSKGTDAKNDESD